jgi:hypothetical protein
VGRSFKQLCRGSGADLTVPLNAAYRGQAVADKWQTGNTCLKNI